MLAGSHRNCISGGCRRVLMHLQVRGACWPWLWNRRHDATSGAQSATGPASTPRDRPAPGADYHISLQSRQAPPMSPTPPPTNSFGRHHAEKPGSKQGLKSRRARRTQPPPLPVVENEQPSAQPPSPSPGTNHGADRSRRGNDPISSRNTTDLGERRERVGGAPPAATHRRRPRTAGRRATSRPR